MTCQDFAKLRASVKVTQKEFAAQVGKPIIFVNVMEQMEGNIPAAWLNDLLALCEARADLVREAIPATVDA